MSWDVMVFNLPTRPRSVSEMKEDDLLPLGDGESARAAISKVLTGVDWSDSTWGVYVGGGFSIEFNVGKTDPVRDIMLHVRGGGDAIGDIMKFIVPNNWTALDCSTGDFLDPIAPSDAGWVGFQNYRDRLLRRNPGEAGGQRK